MGKRAMWAQVRPNVRTSRSHSAVLFPLMLVYFFCGRRGHTTHRHTYQPSDDDAPHHFDQLNAERHQPRLDPAALSLCLCPSLRCLRITSVVAHAHTETAASSRHRLRYYFGIPFRSLCPSISPSQRTDSVIHLFLRQVPWYWCASKPAVRTHIPTARCDSLRLTEANTSDMRRSDARVTTHESATAGLCERRVFSIVS